MIFAAPVVQNTTDISARIAGLADELSRLARSVSPSENETADNVIRLANFEAGGPVGNSRSSQQASSFPHPKRIRRIIRMREMRARYFSGDLFADPAWDMLLDLAAAHAEERRVSVVSLCIASHAAQSTALRWIASMVGAGWIERTDDPLDRRRTFVSLTPTAARAMAAYFDAMDSDPVRVI